MGTTSDDVRGPRIHVVGCGGAGTNSVHRLVGSGVRGVRTVAVNTDKEHLGRTTCDHKVLLGDGAVRGTGGRPEIGARLAAHSKVSITTMVPQRHSGHVFRETPVSASYRSL